MTDTLNAAGVEAARKVARDIIVRKATGISLAVVHEAVTAAIQAYEASRPHYRSKEMTDTHNQISISIGIHGAPKSVTVTPENAGALTLNFADYYGGFPSITMYVQSPALATALHRAIDSVLQREASPWDGHISHCATHNEPAFPNGKCDCGVDAAVELARTCFRTEIGENIGQFEPAFTNAVRAALDAIMYAPDGELTEELDPDRLREDRDERRRINAEDDRAARTKAWTE